jgi:hypothetical protein
MTGKWVSAKVEILGNWGPVTRGRHRDWHVRSIKYWPKGQWRNDRITEKRAVGKRTRFANGANNTLLTVPIALRGSCQEGAILLTKPLPKGNTAVVRV